MSGYDCLLCAMPVVEMNAPLLSPFLLKATLNNAGFRSRCYDFNHDLLHKLVGRKARRWLKREGLATYHQIFADHRHLARFRQDLLDKIIHRWARTLLSRNPRWIGLSMHSQKRSGQIITRELCQAIKELEPGARIVLGGLGAVRLNRTLLAEGLIDAFVEGDGEEPLVAILNGDLNGPGINGNGRHCNENLEAIPFPDYSDLSMRKYDCLYVQGAKGCIGNCTFCATRGMIGGYRRATGSKVAAEMIHNFRTYGKRVQSIADPTLNASTTYLRELCTGLTEFYRQEHSDPFQWDAYFICPPEGKITEEDYDLLKQAGCTRLKVGVESGSEAVRWHMGKRFSNRELDSFVRSCSRTGIKVFMYLMVGYPTETEDDFQQTLNLVTRYSDEPSVTDVTFGYPLHILEHAPLHDRHQEMGIQLDGWEASNSDTWKYWTHKENVLPVRMDRLNRLAEHCNRYKLLPRLQP